MTTALTISPLPLDLARKVNRNLRNRNLLSKVTRDGTTSLTVFIPHTMTAESVEMLVKTMMGFEPGAWPFRHTTFTAT